ncbi:MAG: glycosyltransferase [Lachnospiraceae bacterium]|nr:glycosyltransferase [Lachnospiraceae bacterium]
MKILIVAGSMNVGGQENQIMHLVRKSKEDNIQYDFTSHDKEAFYREEIEAYGGNFIELSYESRPHPIKYSIEMYKIMKKGNYDIVHAHELFHSGLIIFLAWLAGVPCRFAHAHSWREGSGENGYSFSRRCYHTLMRLLINHFSTTQIACSTWAAKYIFGEKKMSKDSCHIVYNSVDTNEYIENYDRVENGDYCEQDGWKNVINVARICSLKNHIFMTSIAKELKVHNKKIRFLFVGDGDDDVKEEIDRIIKEYELSDYIKILGVRKDIGSLLRKSSAFILPSRYEGMPLTMIEAQATGMHCIAADTFSREVDFDIDLVTWLQLTDDVSVWIDAICKAISMERAPKQKVIEAIQRKGFDSQIFAEKICELYKSDYELRGKN